jgi:hypothetical protein
MKKAFALLVLVFIFSNNGSAATKWKKGSFYQGEVTWGKNLKIQLPGKYQLAVSQWEELYGIELKGIVLINEDKKVLKEFIRIEELGSWTYQSQVYSILNEIIYQNRYDGCYERSEYTIVKNKRKGNFTNCFIVRHYDVKKETYHPDDPETSTIHLKYYFKKNKIILPAVVLCSEHYFMAPTVRQNLIILTYCTNPELNGMSKNLFTSEDRSEYHPDNINNYPIKKKYMEEWIKLAAQRHRMFEEGIGAKDHHLLDLSEYGVSKLSTKVKTNSSASGLVEELKELKKLWEEGILNDNEFKKAKEKILSQK